MRELDAWLPDLSPPPGGMVRLRNSVEARRRPGKTGWTMALAAMGAAAMLVAILIPASWQRYRARGALAQVVREAVQPPNFGRMRMVDGGAVVLESGQAGVQLYLVHPTLGGKEAPR